MKKMRTILIAGIMVCIAAGAQAQATNNAYGDNQAQVEPGVFAIYSGDLNQDGFIDVFDFPIFDADNAAFASGYVVSDLNGDGFVDVFDYPVYDANNAAFVSLVRP
jgi:hypothetical protein